MQTKTRQIILFLLCALLMPSCQKSCGKQSKKAQNPEDEAKAAPIKTPPPPHVNNVNFDGLTDTQIGSVSKLFNEEICPCGCPTTFAQCLATKDDCKPAELLADWTVKQVKQGAPEHYLYKAISEEISKGFLAEKRNIDTQGAYRKGNANAPFVIVEFADFECPGCRLAFPEIRAFYEANKNDVQIYFMHLPISSHVNAERAAIAAEAAGKQGKFWEMHDLLFTHNAPLTDAEIAGIAKKIFNPTQLKKFEKDRKDPGILQKIKAHKDYGINVLELEGTPTFIFNGRPYHLSSSKDGFQLRLDMEKARKNMKCPTTDKPSI